LRIGVFGPSLFRLAVGLHGLPDYEVTYFVDRNSSMLSPEFRKVSYLIDLVGYPGPSGTARTMGCSVPLLGFFRATITFSSALTTFFTSPLACLTSRDLHI
jgi:hypothetical protein